MSEFSYPWTCTEVGDGASYSVEMIEMANMFLGNVLPTTSGVVYWKDSNALPGFLYASDDLLEPINSVDDTITIGSGVAFVKGWVYINAENPANPSSFEADGGNNNAVDVIGLRLDVVNQTVRLFYGRGDASDTYDLVQTSAIWEVALAEVTLDGSGNFDELKDVRVFTQTPNDSRVLLYSGTIPSSAGSLISIPNSHMFSKIEATAQLNIQTGSGVRLDLRINNDSGDNYWDSTGSDLSSVQGHALTTSTITTIDWTIYVDRNSQSSGNRSVPITYNGVECPNAAFGSTVDIDKEVWRWDNLLPKITDVDFFLNGSGTVLTTQLDVWGVR